MDTVLLLDDLHHFRSGYLQPPAQSFDRPGRVQPRHEAIGMGRPESIEAIAIAFQPLSQPHPIDPDLLAQIRWPRVIEQRRLLAIRLVRIEIGHRVDEIGYPVGQEQVLESATRTGTAAHVIEHDTI